MRIVILVSALVGISFAIPAWAQPTTWVTSAPVYKPGDSFTGEVDTPTGIPIELKQAAKMGPNGKIYLQMETVEGGIVTSQGVADPVTTLGEISDAVEKTETIASTCTPDKMFPFFIGKKFTCSEEVVINGRHIARRYQYTDLYVKRDSNQRVTALCAVEEEGTDKLLTDTCYTPDGKWIAEVSEPRPSNL